MELERQKRLEMAITERAADFISAESNRQSLITVTRVELLSNTKLANILVSVMPTEKEEEALNFLKRMRSPLREYLRKNIKGVNIPFLEFSIDIGEKNRQRIDEIGRKNL